MRDSLQCTIMHLLNFFEDLFELAIQGKRKSIKVSLQVIFSLLYRKQGAGLAHLLSLVL